MIEFIKNTMVVRLICVLMVLGFSQAINANGQSIQVVTKTINKEMVYNQGEIIKINAEKANVAVTGWDKNYVQLSMKLIAKHKKKEVALEDLRYLKYAIARNENVIEISNYFQTSDALAKVKSNLSAEYTLFVPKNVNLDINLLYGEIKLRRITGNFNAKLNFGQLSLTDVTGVLNLETSYGDLIAKNIDLELTCTAQKANLILDDAKGSYTINSSYGKIELSSMGDLKLFSLTAKNTSARLMLPAFENYNYNLTTSYADIIVPEKYIDIISTSITQRKELKKEFRPQHPLIFVATSFSNITIQSINTLSRK